MSPGAASFSAGIDTMLRHPTQTRSGKLGFGLGFTPDRLYLTSPGTGALYSFEWAQTSPGSTQTPDTVAP